MSLGIVVRLRQAVHRLSPVMFAPSILRLAPPDALTPALSAAGSHPEPARATGPSLSGLFDGLLLAVQKKRTSYTGKRIRRAGQLRMRGPKLQAHVSMCPVCERMRQPHRVCEREDCSTYFKHR